MRLLTRVLAASEADCFLPIVKETEFISCIYSEYCLIKHHPSTEELEFPPAAMAFLRMKPFDGHDEGVRGGAINCFLGGETYEISIFTPALL